jgi:hypothetical protein
MHEMMHDFMCKIYKIFPKIGMLHCVNAFWGSNPTGHSGGGCPLHYQTSGFSCTVHPDIEYFNLCTPENNIGWRTTWFFTKD